MIKINKYFAFLFFVIAQWLPVQISAQNIDNLYAQRSVAVQDDNRTQLQVIDQQLIQLGERPDLIYSKVESEHQTVYSFVPAFDYNATQMMKMNTRLKNVYPKLVDIVKVNTLHMQVIVQNDIEMNHLKEIFLLFRYTYNP